MPSSAIITPPPIEVKLAETSLSTTADAPFINLTGFNDYRFYLYDVVLGTITSRIIAEVSYDNGSNWGLDEIFSHVSKCSRAASTYDADIATIGYLPLNNAVANGQSISGILNAFSMNSPNRRVFTWEGSYFEANSGYTSNVGGGTLNSNTAVNAIRFRSLSGTMTSGKIICTGVK